MRAEKRGTIASLLEHVPFLSAPSGDEVEGINIFALLGFIFAFVFPLAGLILSIIGLHQTKDFDYPAITYFGLNTEKRIQQLKENGLKNFTERMGKNNQSLTTWEGQHFFLFSLGM